MLPRWHILLGAVLTILIWILAPTTHPIYLALFFLSSFLIDFDHYLSSYFKTKSWKLRDSFEYHKKQGVKQKRDISKGIKRKGDDFHFFHTIEFHALVGILGLVWIGFFYIFAGMIFHSLTDIISLTRTGAFHRREYFLSNWVSRKLLS